MNALRFTDQMPQDGSLIRVWLDETNVRRWTGCNYAQWYTTTWRKYMANLIETWGWKWWLYEIGRPE